MLLRCGAAVNAEDILRMTPLHWAAENGHASVCEALLRKGGDSLAESKVMKWIHRHLLSIFHLRNMDGLTNRPT